MVKFQGVLELSRPQPEVYGVTPGVIQCSIGYLPGMKLGLAN